MATVPIFAPDGTLGDIPQDKLQAAVQAGAKPGVHITSPDGKDGVIPADRLQDAVKAGAKVVPLADQPTRGWFEGAGSALWNNIKSIPASFAADDPMTQGSPISRMLGDTKPTLSDTEKFDLYRKNVAAQEAQQAQRVKEHGHLYDIGATTNEMLGVNVAGEEQAAKEGNPGAVIGHAATVPAMMAAAAVLRAGVGAAKRGLLLGRTPEEAYQSALKPSTTIKPAKVTNIVQTGLQQGIPVSPAGMEKIGGLIDDLNDKIANEIGGGQGKTVDPVAVAQRADAVKGKFATQVNPTADLQAIEASKQEFLQNNPNPIPAAEAQAMKQGTYQQLSAKAYGELKGASIEAQKALARGLKEELANQFPELNSLNAEEGKLLDLKPVLEKAIQREANHQLGGIGTPITAGAAKAVTGSNTAAAVAGMLKAVVDNPNIKSRLAISLSKTGIPLPMANARIAAYSAALASAASQQNPSMQPDGSQ